MKKYFTNDCKPDSRNSHSSREESGVNLGESTLYAAEFLLYAFHFDRDPRMVDAPWTTSSRLTMCPTSEQ